MATRATTVRNTPEAEPDTIEVSAAGQQFDGLVDRVVREGSRVVVERDGMPVAALVSAKDLWRLRTFDATVARRKQLVAEFREPFQGVPAEEIEREVVNAVAAVRARRPADRPRVGNVAR